MVSPISSLLPEFKLRPLEKDILKNIKPASSTWIRYVNDIFEVWEHGLETLQDFPSEINKIDNNIEFTMEIENSNILPFVDFLLIKEDNKLNRKVY